MFAQDIKPDTSFFKESLYSMWEKNIYFSVWHNGDCKVIAWWFLS